MRRARTLNGILGIVSMAGGASAQTLGANLVVNGDAETGTMDPWTPTDQLQVTPSSGPGSLGLPGGVSIGDWCFAGVLGSAVERCEQTIDLGALASQIDGEGLVCEFSALVQDRVAGGGADVMRLRLRFLDTGGGELGLLQLTDPSAPNGVFDWNEVSAIGFLPVGTRALLCEMETSRNAGSSTDAFADNISAVLAEPCEADITRDGRVNTNDFFAFLTIYQAGDPGADFTGEGDINTNDFFAFLAFYQGCAG